MSDRLPPLSDLRELRSRSACRAVDRWPTGTPLRQHVKGLPVLIRSLGLASAVALLHARGETRPLAEDLAAWLLQGHPARPLGQEAGGVPAFLRAFVKLSSAEARGLESEGLRYAEALKLYAGALHA